MRHVPRLLFFLFVVLTALTPATSHAATPSSADTTLVRAEAALEAGAYDRAITLYRRHLEAQPESYDGQFGLARALSYSGRRPEAVDLLSEMLQAQPTNPDLHVVRGYTYLALGHLPEAAADFQAALAVAPDYPDAREGLEQTRARRHRSTETGAPPRRLTTTAGYDVEAFTDDRAAWQEYAASASYDAGRAVLLGTYYRTTRFDRWSNALAADAYVDLWPQAYLHARALVGLDARIHPNADLWLEVFQGVGGNWQPFVTLRYIDYPEDRVYVGGGGLVKYLPRWYLRGTVTGLSLDGHVRGFALLTARHYLGGVDTYVEGRVGYGHEVTRLSPDQVFDSGSSYTASARIQHYLTPGFGVSVGGTATKSAPLPLRAGLSLQVLRRW